MVGSKLTPIALLLVACRAEPPPPPAEKGGEAPAKTEAQSPKPSESASALPRKGRIVIVAGGDVDFSRLRGERLAHEPGRDDFAPLAALLSAADLRFVNLESTISDHRPGPTTPAQKLVFTAPPLAAEALARARVDVVSLANNHAWDYGEDGLLQTFANLDRVHVAYAGAGRSRDEAYAPRIVTVGGWRVAFIAVTAVWNQEWEPHPGKQRVADAVREPLVAAIRRARELGAERVIVSQHGGDEYLDAPREGTRALAIAAIEAGADAFIGHHPHVIQRVALVRGKPVFYSLGNLLMRMTTGKPWTEYGILARLGLDERGVEVAICPYRIWGLDPVPLAGDGDRRLHEPHFRAIFERLLKDAAFTKEETALAMGALGQDGCAALSPRADR